MFFMSKNCCIPSPRNIAETRQKLQLGKKEKRKEKSRHNHSQHKHITVVQTILTTSFSYGIIKSNIDLIVLSSESSTEETTQTI